MANGMKMGDENEVKSVRVCECVCVYSYLVDELLLILFYSSSRMCCCCCCLLKLSLRFAFVYTLHKGCGRDTQND